MPVRSNPQAPLRLHVTDREADRAPWTVVVQAGVGVIDGAGDLPSCARVAPNSPTSFSSTWSNPACAGEGQLDPPSDRPGRQDPEAGLGELPGMQRGARLVAHLWRLESGCTRSNGSRPSLVICGAIPAADRGAQPPLAETRWCLDSIRTPVKCCGKDAAAGPPIHRSPGG